MGYYSNTDVCIYHISLIYDIQYLEHNKNKKQSECLFPLFEVHITLGFKSEVSASVFILMLNYLLYFINQIWINLLIRESYRFDGYQLREIVSSVRKENPGRITYLIKYLFFVIR